MPTKTNDSPSAPSLSRLMKLVEDIDYAMLTTVGANGLLVSRPLSTQQSTVDDVTVRFFTAGSSAKVEEIERDDRVNLAYASSSKNVFVSFAGRGRVHRDPGLIDALWSDAMKAFFPKGKSDPDLVILEVVGETAEVWEGPSSLIGKAIAFVNARITGNTEALGSSSLLNLQAGRKTSPTKTAPTRTSPTKATRSGTQKGEVKVSSAAKPRAAPAGKATQAKSGSPKSGAASKNTSVARTRASSTEPAVSRSNKVATSGSARSAATDRPKGSGTATRGGRS